jgi:hypothetical protein
MWPLEPQRPSLGDWALAFAVVISATMLTRVRKAALLLAWMLSACKRQLPSKRTFSNRRRFVRTRAPRCTWSPATFDEIDCKLNEWEFKRTSRLSRTVFNEVHGLTPAACVAMKPYARTHLVARWWTLASS